MAAAKGTADATSVHSPDSTVAPRAGAISLADLGRTHDNCIHIGLVNNMPGAALQATERQFRSLLDAAADGIEVRLSLFAIPEVSRSDGERRLMANRYSTLNELWNCRLDGLIVTGAEPVAADLRDEPYWASVTKLADWAEQNTYSSVWSCLAAHAALLHLDGIGRRPLRQKLSGVFACTRVSDHPLTAMLPALAHTPHSRWNDVPADALMEGGYRILTQSAHAGVDAFVKQRKSLFVFFQGHPEYETDSLLLEYRRDVRRFLRGERNSYPSMPQGCLDEETSGRMHSLEGRARSDRREELLADFPAALLASKVTNTWRAPAIAIYRNWLRRLHARKQERPGVRRG